MAEQPGVGDEGIRRRGRPRGRRQTVCSGPFRCYAPQCEIQDGTGKVTLLPEEIDILRLIDLEGLEQEEAATVLGISRRTLWKDLHEARRKVTDALVNGRVIEMSGCSRRIEGICPKSEDSYCPKQDGGVCPRGCQIQNPE
ncbi:MAG: DNA-binding protein [Methanomicrobiales archaeon HGW-Methanomicrobiales-4]|nr:MAG: DNA-binding protein [Methanomicrobiales archaeon HGW-Methanomicrobiales-4]